MKASLNSSKNFAQNSSPPIKPQLVATQSQNNSPSTDKKIINQALDRALRDLETNKDSYLLLRKEYDRAVKHENMFNRPMERLLKFREIKKKFKTYVETHFYSIFPGARERANIGRNLKVKEKQKSQKKQESNQKPRNFDELLSELIYRPEFSRFIEERIELYIDDAAIHML